jgi:hypothetical protein
MRDRQRGLATTVPSRITAPRVDVTAASSFMALQIAAGSLNA